MAGNITLFDTSKKKRTNKCICCKKKMKLVGGYSFEGKYGKAEYETYSCEKCQRQEHLISKYTPTHHIVM